MNPLPRAEESNSFGYWLRRRRKALDWTQAELAHRVNCTAAMIRKIEADERKPSRQLAELLADQLRIPAAQRAGFLQAARQTTLPDHLTYDALTPIPSPPPNNLPTPLTSFIGRQREIAEVKRLLVTTRLLTLTGSGGCGKTRLAIQVANDVARKDGVWWVDLAALSDLSLMPQAVGAVLGILESPGIPIMTMLANYLRAKETLLVFDNCEHLIDACARLIETLLSACPRLQIMLTSRQALGIAGETTWRVPSLLLADLPQGQMLNAERWQQYDAIQLFNARALAIAPQWNFAENAALVAEICVRLDGMPLPIELAAARLKVLSAEQIAVRLDDRFRLLTGGSRTALPRQQTLRATMDWSYELLSDEERVLFRHLAVFVGGWTLEAAEEVCDDRYAILDLLTSLADKSLVIVAQKHGQMRYQLLETVREYSREKMIDAGEEEQTRNRHLEYFVQLAEQAYPEILTAKEKYWADSLENEMDNIRAALAWGIEHDLDGAARLASSLHFFWDAYSHLQEARDWLERIIPKIQDWGNDIRRARVLNAAGNIIRAQLEHHTARLLFEQSLAISQAIGARWETAFAFWGLGIAHHFFNDSGLARFYLERALTLYQELGSENFPARILRYMGSLAHQEGDLVLAQKLFGDAIELARRAGDRMCLAGAVYSLGNVSLEQEDYRRAAILYEECWALCKELPSGSLSINAERSLAVIALRQGDYKRASPLLENCIALYRKQGSHTGIVHCLEEFARSGILMGKLIEGVRLLGAADALRESLHVHLPRFREDWKFKRAEMLADLVALIGQEAFAREWHKGRKMTLDEAIDYALENLRIT